MGPVVIGGGVLVLAWALGKLHAPAQAAPSQTPATPAPPLPKLKTHKDPNGVEIYDEGPDKGAATMTSYRLDPIDSYNHDFGKFAGEALTGALSGAATGFAIGGPIGAAIGGFIGAIPASFNNKAIIVKMLYGANAGLGVDLVHIFLSAFDSPYPDHNFRSNTVVTWKDEPVWWPTIYTPPGLGFTEEQDFGTTNPQGLTFADWMQTGGNFRQSRREDPNWTWEANDFNTGALLFKVKKVTWDSYGNTAAGGPYYFLYSVQATYQANTWAQNADGVWGDFGVPYDITTIDETQGEPMDSRLAEAFIDVCAGSPVAENSLGAKLKQAFLSVYNKEQGAIWDGVTKQLLAYEGK